MNSSDLLAALKAHTQWTAIGDPLGNLSLGRGMVEGQPAHIAIVENKIASGSLSVKECDRLAALFRVVAMQRTQLVLYLDSAGARVSEGLPALGAFRHLYRAALELAMSGAGFQCLLGANCFGGASMLAALATTRIFSDNTRLAMSGPSILAQTAGASALDDMFQAISFATIGAAGRAKLGDGNVVSGSTLTLTRQTTRDFAGTHRALKARLPQARNEVPESLVRNDITKLYPAGYTLQWANGILSGTAKTSAGEVEVLGVIGKGSLGAARAHALANMVWAKLIAQPKVLHLLVECESHATTMDDERVMLSSYLADLACALSALRRSGCSVVTHVLTKLGGGVYVALCAPTNEVALIYGAEILVLPGKAIASILGQNEDQFHPFDDYLAARVAEVELKLGIV